MLSPADRRNEQLSSQDSETTVTETMKLNTNAFAYTLVPVALVENPLYSLLVTHNINFTS